MIGSPPSCRPECVISPECEMSKACKNNKCVDPCGPGVCGVNARCQVKSHSPICTCLPGYNGDPFIKCEVIRDDEPIIPKAPCTPNPCGPYSICREISDSPACSCLEGYLGGKKFYFPLPLYCSNVFIIMFILNSTTKLSTRMSS